MHCALSSTFSGPSANRDILSLKELHKCQEVEVTLFRVITVSLSLNRLIQTPKKIFFLFVSSFWIGASVFQFEYIPFRLMIVMVYRKYISAVLNIFATICFLVILCVLRMHNTLALKSRTSIKCRKTVAEFLINYLI